MALHWTQDLSVGVEEIDAQHKELYRRINALLDAMRQGKGTEEVSKTVAFLERYVVTHFGTEEKYMVKLLYPSYPAHKAEHTAFIKDFAATKKELQTQGMSSTLAIGLQRKLGDWLLNHISKTDKVLGSFMLAKV